VDGAGNAYVTGSTASNNFPTTTGAFQISLGGGYDAFVTKLNASGTALVYSTYLGGSGGDYGDGIAVDGSGNAYIIGATMSTNFPTTTGAFKTTNESGNFNAFVTKLNANGTALVYSTYLGGNFGVLTSYGDSGNAIAVDGAGNAYVTGNTGSADFPTTAGAFQTSYGGPSYDGDDAFVTKLNATGTALINSTYLGGSYRDSGNGIAVDGSGNAYVTGQTNSTNFPTTTGAFQTSIVGGTNSTFVTKLNTTGTALVYSTYIGGNNDNNGYGIAVDVTGNAYVTGSTFVTRLNPSGTALIYSTFLGGNGITLDSSGNAYVTGSTASSNFPTTTGAFQTSLGGTENAFVAKFTFAVLPTNHFQVTVQPTGNTGEPVSFTVIALEQNNNTTDSSYTGTVHFTSTDGAAKLPGDMMLTNGTGTFSATFNTAGTQTISVNDTTSPGILGTSNLVTVSAVATQFAVSAPATVTAGTPFLATVIAEDGGGHIVSGYSGTVVITGSSFTPELFRIITLTNGVGAFLVTMREANISFTIMATDMVTSSITGTSGKIVVSPGAVSFFTVGVPAGGSTIGKSVQFTVAAYDSSGNIAKGYTGKVHFTSSDSTATLPTDSALTNGRGVFNVTFNTGGLQTVTATDTVASNPTITGTSSSIVVSGLIVTTFAQTPTGFVVTFNQPFIASDIAENGAASLVQPVTLVGAKNLNINGTLLFDSTSPATLTFNATASTLLALTGGEQVLPDDNYTVTLVSGSAGSNGFQDALGGLDGADNGGHFYIGGHANYVNIFSTSYQTDRTPEIGIPDFARGPSGATAQPISVPNDTGKGGIPITLYNATAVNDATFTLTYDPTLLTVTGAGIGDATGPGSTLTLVSSTANTATFHYQDATAHSGTVVLGDILAYVPTTANVLYKNKELLQLGSITVNGASFTGVVANSVHVNAYFGDVNGDGKIDSTDTSIITVVASTNPGSSTGFTGFPAYSLLDPVIIGDLAGNGAVDSGSITILNNFNVGLYASAKQIPIPPVLTGVVSPNVVQAAVSSVGTTPQLTALALPSDAANAAADSEQTAVIDHVFAQFAKNQRHHRRAGDVSPLILFRRSVS